MPPKTNLDEGDDAEAAPALPQHLMPQPQPSNVGFGYLSDGQASKLAWGPEQPEHPFDPNLDDEQARTSKITVTNRFARPSIQPPDLISSTKIAKAVNPSVDESRKHVIGHSLEDWHRAYWIIQFNSKQWVSPNLSKPGEQIK
ncbi:hypothetical protein ACLMJK_000070 [Lecanora helva]